jgi:hypothetical protein
VASRFGGGAFRVISAVEMSEEAEIYDDDDCVLGDWTGAVPWKMKRWTEHKLYFAQVQNGGGQYSRLVEAELSRRRNNELKNHIKALATTTDSVRTATEGVDKQVSRLADSSDKMEGLTIKLKNLTVALIIIAVAQTVVAGIQTWKMFTPEPERPVQVVVQPPQSTTPQTPPSPAPR